VGGAPFSNVLEESTFDETEIRRRTTTLDIDTSCNEKMLRALRSSCMSRRAFILYNAM